MNLLVYLFDTGRICPYTLYLLRVSFSGQRISATSDSASPFLRGLMLIFLAPHFVIDIFFFHVHKSRRHHGLVVSLLLANSFPGPCFSNALEKRTKDIVNKMLLEEGVLRRSTRVRAQPKDNPSMAFLKYVNKWKDN